MQSNGGSDYKAQILATVNIVEMIGQSVALKKRGRDYVGLCPFHSEKSPSFKVDPTKQFFYCFGCKASGNAIDFVMKRDRVDFMEAMRQLGQQAGIEMPKFGVSKQKTDEKNSLIDAHSAACAFFENSLKDPQAGAIAREYLAKRGISPQTTARFRIGLAPDGWEGLLRSPVGRKFGPQTLALGGLLKVRENGGGYYDTFRNRLMFPIRDTMGRIIAFGGRAMPGSTDAKYLNSPETPLFNKSACVYGIDLAAKKIAESRNAVVVEGYTDVVIAHQFGVENVVSVLGTAMTVQHLNMLRRLADKVVLLFDADVAGDTAVDRVVELFLTQPIEMAIASMPPGVDPDEFLLSKGAEAFEKILSGASDVLSFKWKQLARTFISEAGDLTGQQNAVEKYLKLLADARGSGPVDSLRWGSALARVSRLTEIPIDELNKRFRARPARPRRLAVAHSTAGSATQSQPSGEESPPAMPPRPHAAMAQDTAERWVLGVLLTDPDRWERVQIDVAAADFDQPLCGKLARTFWEHQRDEGAVVFREFLSLLTEPGLTELAVELVEEISELEAQSSLDEILNGALGYLAEQRQRREQIKLLGELRRNINDGTAITPQVTLPNWGDDDRAPDDDTFTSADSVSDPAQGDGAIAGGDATAREPAPDSGYDEKAKLLLFEQLVKKNQSTDLRRLGPVRRSRP